MKITCTQQILLSISFDSQQSNYKSVYYNLIDFYANYACICVFGHYICIDRYYIVSLLLYFQVSGDNPVYVESVKPGGAAQKAGLMEGDMILKVNDKQTPNIFFHKTHTHTTTTNTHTHTSF